MKPSPTLPTNLPTTQELWSDVLSLADEEPLLLLPTPPAIGHNQPAFDDVVAENLRRGLYLTQRDVLINSLRDALGSLIGTGWCLLPSLSIRIRGTEWPIQGGGR